MKVIFKGIDHLFDTTQGKVHEVVIENQLLLKLILEDLYGQVNGIDGSSVLSENEIPIAFNKNCEILTQWVPFVLNTKSLTSKLGAAFEKKAVASDCYNDTMEEIGRLNAYLDKIAFGLSGDIQYKKLNISSVMKAVGPEFNEDYDNLNEKILDYMELVSEYDCKKLFICVNLRTFLVDSEVEDLLEEIIKRDIDAILLESTDRRQLRYSQKYIIDDGLCEIS